MSVSCCALILLLTTGSAVASRVNVDGQAQEHIEGARLCNLTESEHAIGYGIHGLFPVKSCMLECKYNMFLTDALPNKIMAEPEQEEGSSTCKCNYAPRYWEGASNKVFWYQFRINSLHKCTKDSCWDVFVTWGNNFLKRMAYPGASERMPPSKLIEAQDNYNMECAEGMPGAIHLPSPGAKIHELRLMIASTTDPEEKARLQKLLEELLGDKQVEVFGYDLEGDWGEEHHPDNTGGSDLHSFYVKPCKSNLGNEVTDLHEVEQFCGPWVLGVSMKEGKVRYQYKIDENWGPEQVCEAEEATCQILQDEAAKDGWKLLSFRMKPCMTPSGDREVTGLSEIMKEDHCGNPTLRESLLPVKVSASHKFDATAPEDELAFPCP